jgi:hypothetical protein
MIELYLLEQAIRAERELLDHESARRAAVLERLAGAERQAAPRVGTHCVGPSSGPPDDRGSARSQEERGSRLPVA